ncbi:hypothetical protein ACF1BK_01245 [Streptomyces globisporus]|uniref:hypothetical protein n=1 Tax=Streptomyces globisporus TaxID=1908 RepID=UPI0036FAFBFB
MSAPTAPPPAALLDHRGRRRARAATHLTHEQAHLGTAFHEAGHAVVAMSYGMHVVSSEVIAWVSAPGQSTVTGVTSVSVESLEAIHPWRFAAQAAAGEIAQVQYLMVHGLWTPQRAMACAAAHDRDQAVDVLASLGYRLDPGRVPAGGKSWAMVQGMARRRIGYLWREIRTVAEAMDKRTMLTGDEIAMLTGLNNPRLIGGAA